MSEVPLGKQSLHAHVHLVLEQPIDRNASQHTDGLLHEGAGYRGLLGKQARLDLAIATDTMKDTVAVLQDEEDLPVLVSVAAVGQGHGSYLLKDLGRQAVIFLQSWVHKLYLAAYQVVEPNQEHIFNLFDGLCLEVLDPFFDPWHVGTVEVLGKLGLWLLLCFLLLALGKLLHLDYQHVELVLACLVLHVGAQGLVGLDVISPCFVGL